MSGLRPGEIRITAFLAGDTVQRVAITADRPVSLASAMIGRPVAFVADAMAALHGLCGQSHAAAVHFAAAAAAGTTPTRTEAEHWIIRLAGERLGEHLRTLFAADGMDPPSAERLAALRTAISVGQRAAQCGTVSLDAASRLTAALSILGLLASPGAGEQVAPARVDALSSGDDSAILAALAADTSFIRAPHLPGRAPETGPAARHAVSAADPGAAQAARQAEIRQACALLPDSSAATPEDWISAGPIGPNAGYAAVETPRGRLYYRLVLGADRQLLEARVLAPTEWNFHPDGPLARALTGFRPGRDAAAAITRRAAAFDPCVALRVAIESAARA
jgi:coenzyme F420-reducing hydrogenase alpha subunit